MTPEYCPNCGAAVPRGARACPTCGSDESTGWSDQAAFATSDEDGFDYDRFIEREFGQEGSLPPGIHWFWWLVGVVLVMALARFLIL